MVYSWFDVAVAATIAAAAIAAALALDTWQRYHRRRARAQLRAAGAGPYEPTHDVPRVDLALAIAEHLRLKYRVVVKLTIDTRRLVAAIDDAMRVSLRAATLLNRPLDS